MLCKSRIEELHEGILGMTNFAFHSIQICSLCFTSDLLTAYVTSDIQYENENTLQIFSGMNGVQFSLSALWYVGRHRCLKKLIKSQTLVTVCG